MKQCFILKLTLLIPKCELILFLLQNQRCHCFCTASYFSLPTIHAALGNTVGKPETMSFGYVLICALDKRNLLRCQHLFLFV